jgi:hypothetical protein
MSNGAVVSVLEPCEREKAIVARVSEIDGFLWNLRERIRSGDLIANDDVFPEEVGVPA